MKSNALTTTTANSYRLHLKTGQCTHSKPLLWKGYKTFTEHNNLWKLNSPRVIYLVIPDDISYLYIIFGFVVFWRGRGGGDKKHSEPSQQWIMKNKFTLISQQEWTTLLHSNRLAALQDVSPVTSKTILLVRITNHLLPPLTSANQPITYTSALEWDSRGPRISPEYLILDSCHRIFLILNKIRVSFVM